MLELKHKCAQSPHPAENPVLNYMFFSCWICCNWVNELWKPLHECLFWMRHLSQSHFHLKASVIHMTHNGSESVRSTRTMTDDKLMQRLSCRLFYFLMFFCYVTWHFKSCLYFSSQYHQLLDFDISLYSLWCRGVIASLVGLDIFG